MNQVINDLRELRRWDGFAREDPTEPQESKNSGQGGDANRQDDAASDINCQKWRRRESNAAPLSPIDVTGQQLTTLDSEVSAHCLPCVVTNCPALATIDAVLVRIAEVWPTLPQSIRKQVEALCLEPASRDSAD